MNWMSAARNKLRASRAIALAGGVAIRFITAALAGVALQMANAGGQPGHFVTQVETKLPSGVPSLDDMAGEWIPVATTVNPPAVHNFHDILLVNRDITSFFCYPEDWLWQGKPRLGYPPVTLTLDGREFQTTDYRWYAYRALRRNPNCDGLDVESDARMINEQRAILVRVHVSNRGATLRREMTDFVKRELFQCDWLRAMSLKDAAAAHSDRPDHEPLGAYDGWIPLTVGTMWRLGFPSDAFDFYCRTATVTKEGPFAQAREFYGPNRQAYDAPVRVAEREGCMKECISGVAFTAVVLDTFFGFMPSLDGKSLLVDPNIPRPFAGSLKNVQYRGKMFTLAANAGGVQCNNQTKGRTLEAIVGNSKK